MSAILAREVTLMPLLNVILKISSANVCTLTLIPLTRSVSLCGYWSLPPHFYPAPDSSVMALLRSLPTPPLYIGFGSMETYLLDMDWSQLFATLEEGKCVYF